MADATSPGGGGGGTAFTIAQYVEDGRIKVGALLTTIVGAGVYAYFQGVVSTILAIFDIPISLLAWFGDFAATLVDVLVGFPRVILERGWQATVPFVVEAGPAGYVAAIGVVLTTLWVVAEVTDRAL